MTMHELLDQFVENVVQLYTEKKSKAEALAEALGMIFEQEEDLHWDPEKIAYCETLLQISGFEPGVHCRQMAAYMAAFAEEKNYEIILKKMKMLCRLIRQEYPEEEGKMEILWAGALAVSDITVPEFQQRISRIQELLRQWIDQGREMTAMNYTLLLFHTDDIALCERAMWLYRCAREADCKDFSAEYLTLLALNAVSQRKAQDAIREMQEFQDLLIERIEWIREEDEALSIIAAAFSLFLLFREKESRKQNVVIRSMNGDFLLLTELICAAALEMKSQ